MIKRTEKGMTIVFFGGSIIVGVAREETTNNAILVIQCDDNEYEIGEPIPGKEGEKIGDNQNNVLLVFDDVKSIDVVIKQLKIAKKTIKN